MFKIVRHDGILVSFLLVFYLIIIQLKYVCSVCSGNIYYVINSQWVCLDC